jgi:hypothetical protein
MATVNLGTMWTDGDTLTASALNNKFQVITTQVNGNIDSTNMATLTTTLTCNVTTNIDVLALTKSGSGAGSIIEASDAGTDPLLNLTKTGNGIGININTDATTVDAVNIDANSLTTGYGIDMANLDALTSGIGLNIRSNSADTTARNLLYLLNDNTAATGCVALFVKQDSTNHAVEIVGELVISG